MFSTPPPLVFFFKRETPAAVVATTRNDFILWSVCVVSIASLIVFLLLVVLDVLTRKVFKSKKTPPLIEWSGGLKIPLVGGMLEFLKGPMKLMAKAFPKYGEVFTVPVFHERITFLIGPKVSEFFFKAKDVEMSQKEVYEFNVPTFGKGVVFDVDHQTRAEQFRWIHHYIMQAGKQALRQLQKF